MKTRLDSSEIYEAKIKRVKPWLQICFEYHSQKKTNGENEVIHNSSIYT